ncbi:hypothetical protein ACFLQU_04015 [Verrucomicrobiota bacterium]
MGVKAGIATRVITPEAGVKLFGYPRFKRVGESISDPLLVSALHLRSGASGIILVSLDLFWVDTPTARSIRSRISEAVSMTEQHLFVACTNNHSGPSMAQPICWMGDYRVPKPDEAYVEKVAFESVEAAGAAAATTMPSEVGWTQCTASIAGGNLSPDGPAEMSADLLVVRLIDSKKVVGIAAVCDLRPGVLDEQSMQVSSDYPSHTRRLLKEHFGDDCLLVQFTAPSGDQGTPLAAGGTGAEEAERIGRLFSESIIAAIEAMGQDEFTSDPVLSGSRTSIVPTRRTLPGLWDAQLAWGDRKAELQRLQQEGAPENQVRAALRGVVETDGLVYMVRSVDAGAIDGMLEPYGRVDVQVMRAAGKCIAGMPGVLYRAYGDKIREATGGKAVPASLANGELQGCIVTPEAAAAGDYSSLNSPFAPEVGDKLVDAVLSIVPDDLK